MTTTRAMGIVPSRPRRALLEVIIILSILPLVSCSFNFDMPGDKNVADGYQKRTTGSETAPAQPGSQPRPMPSSSAGEDGRKWTSYTTDDGDTKYFYDKDAIMRSSNNIIQMWRKREFPPGAAQERIVTLDEIDCRKTQYRTLELRVTYSDGTTGRSNEATRWVKIHANSSEEYLMRENCK